MSGVRLYGFYNAFLYRFNYYLFLFSIITSLFISRNIYYPFLPSVTPINPLLIPFNPL